MHQLVHFGIDCAQNPRKSDCLVANCGHVSLSFSKHKNKRKGMKADGRTPIESAAPRITEARTM